MQKADSLSFPGVPGSGGRRQSLLNKIFIQIHPHEGVFSKLRIAYNSYVYFLLIEDWYFVGFSAVNLKHNESYFAQEQR
jgi:hypothetical protein